MVLMVQIQLSRILDIPSIVREKPSASNKKKTTASIKALKFRGFSKYKNNFLLLFLNLFTLFAVTGYVHQDYLLK